MTPPHNASFKGFAGDTGAAAAIFRLDTSYCGGETHGLIALGNAQIREITQLGRFQVVAIMKDLQAECGVTLTRRGRFSLWNLASPLEPEG